MIAEELLDFVGAGLRIFGPSTRFTLFAPTFRAKFAFPPDPSWVAPQSRRVQASAQRKTARGRKS